MGKETGDVLGATRALHGLARMGRARQVVDELGALASKVDGELTAARLAYTSGGRRQGQPRRSQRPPRRFEDLGAHLYAAEAFGESAVHLRRDGASRDAAATQQTAARLLARCEGAVTPFVRAIGARAQLTPAELDTALQAATGSTDKQIAEMMHLSVRTVENRLASRLPEARDLPSTRAGRGAAGPARHLISPGSQCAAFQAAHPARATRTTAVTILIVAMLIEPEQALAADHGEARHRPESEGRTHATESGSW